LVAFAVATTFGAVGLVAFASATTIVVRHGGPLPPWLAWLGCAMTVTGVATLAAPLFSHGPFAIGGAANIALTQGEMSFWIIAVSTAMLRARATSVA
jgi:hypothetical protein